MEEWRYSSTILDLDTREASRPGSFNAEERAHRTHWIGGWVGPRVDKDAKRREKSPLPGIEERSSSP
jgi:hypothetical protein